MKPTRFYFRIALMLALVVLTSAGTSFCYSQDELPEAFSDQSKYPWIDAETSKLVPPPMRAGSEPINDPVAPGNRDSDWIHQPKPNPPAAPAGGASLGSSIFSTIMEVVFLVVLGLTIAALAAVLVWAFFRTSESNVGDAETGETTAVGGAARFEELPEPLRREEGDLLAAARRCYEQGEFAEAIVYLFSYQLIELDRKQIIRLTRGKTNQQYLRESRNKPTLAAILETTINTFEDAFFGRYEIDRRRFEICWNELDRFQAEIQST